MECYSRKLTSLTVRASVAIFAHTRVPSSAAQASPSIQTLAGWVRGAEVDSCKLHVQVAYVGLLQQACASVGVGSGHFNTVIDQNNILRNQELTLITVCTSVPIGTCTGVGVDQVMTDGTILAWPTCTLVDILRKTRSSLLFHVAQFCVMANTKFCSIAYQSGIYLR